jgi:NADH dehydrogenase (ubiquinone) Fe-S protein 1
MMEICANEGYSSPTMARASAAKAQKNPRTDFMAPGEQLEYGPKDSQLAANV